ncbi:MAG: hypothetical protein JWL69_2156 [Phycisphaerales bacterium]|nr:hypothetical protein [Phycisphaerales bacterium]
MPVFTYKAQDEIRSDVTGTIAADTPRQARDLLRGRGLIVRDLADSGTLAKPTVRRRKSRAPRHLATLFIREISTLLGVGVPLLEALDTLSDQYRGKFRGTVLQLRERVAAGTNLASAMGEHPETFDDLCVNITAVGEDAGTLDSSLERLAEFRERSELLRGKIGTALIYPAIVLGMAMFAGTFLMTFVVPRIIQPLVDQHFPLPFPTRVVKGAADFLLNWWWLVLSVVSACGLGIAAILRSERGKLAWHRIVLRLPLVGELIRKQAIVRIAVVTSTLLKSGIVFVRALQIAERSAGNLVLRDALRRCEQAVSAGGDIGQALAETGAFPPMVVQIFALGQQSGRLEEMLDRLATSYDQQVSSAAQRLAAMLEPVLILLLALVVGFIVLATVLPILEAGNAVQ